MVDDLIGKLVVSSIDEISPKGEVQNDDDKRTV